jgi:polar amino acid transport system permease protein
VSRQTGSSDTKAEPGTLAHLLSFCAASALVALGCYFTLRQLAWDWNWEPVWRYRLKFWNGWLVTIALSLASLGLSTILGLAAALARRCPVLVVRYLARFYVEAIRGTPLLVQILIFFYGVFDQVGITNRYVAGVLILSGFSGAYISEIIRAGIEGIGKSQLDSARAIGLTTWQTYRHVIFPQALRRILPPVAGQFASLIKDSSLLSIIGIGEFTLNAQEVNSYTYSTLESYLPLALGYLLLTLPISLWTQSLETRHRFET